MIDLRSDTVTVPSAAMRAAIASAEVGDDVFGDDPTVNRLEEMAAARLGKEAAVFVPSGTQGNLLGVMSHCQRGDEYIAGQTAHAYRTEGGGAAVLGSIQPQPVDFEADGTLDLDRVEATIKPHDDPHYARSRLFCLENTVGGKALPMDYLPLANDLARRHSLGTHLDGARVFNAAIKRQVDVTEITRYFDTVSFCLSKGLGAPVGSVLCGSSELIDSARRWRKVLGGGMRQAGILAAAGIYALENNVDRLTEDHVNAAALAAGLGEIDGLDVDFPESQTNMVFMTFPGRDAEELTAFLKERGILTETRTRLRLVTHLGVSAGDVPKVVAAFAEFFSG
jgi:threonine aldolase